MDMATRVGNGDPVMGLSVVTDWSNMLSLGEQQRLAFGRILVNRPRLVILDEATSALDTEAEARMYNVLQTMALEKSNGDLTPGPSLTYVSVGHRPSLLVFHNKRLRLGGQSNHELSNIEQSSWQGPTRMTNLS
jgi:ABC-type uncharacterized transport system fused permease/ATPase subunit